MVNKCKKYRYIFQEKAKLHNLPNARIIYLYNGLLSSLEKQFFTLSTYFWNATNDIID